MPKTHTVDASVTQEDWRGVIIVMFKKGTSSIRIRELIRLQGCRLQDGFDGRDLVNVVVIPKGARDEDYVERFSRLKSVDKVSLNNEEIPLVD